ncbi:MAG: PDZ domain-containing protein [Oligoflexia bacterium]|nr:PDZ domain-containing protein [Oligoflexia bacterium]
MKFLVSLLLFISFQANAASAGIDCGTIFPVMNLFLEQHYSQKKLTPELEERTIQQFIKATDPSKLYLMESDVTQMKSLLSGLYAKLRDKKCEDLEAVRKIYEKRVEEAVQFAKKSLTKDFKLKEDITLLMDPEKRGYSKDRKELEDLQTKFIHFQMSNYLSNDMKLKEALKSLEHRYEVVLKHLREQKKDDLYNQAIDAFASSLDPHSNFLSKDYYDDFLISMNLSLEGIGATLSSQDGYTVIENLIPGGAAERSGELEPKDKIIGVAQGTSDKFVTVIDMPLRDVVKLIRGKKGSKVTLSILRQGKTTKRFTISLLRDKIDLKEEAAKLSFIEKKVGDQKLKIGIINLPSFYADSEGGGRSCFEDVRKLVLEAKAKKVDGLVLDLSKNGGGVLGEAQKIAGLFIKKGNVVATQDDGRVNLLADLDSSVAYNGPLVVLTSRLSASASEIVAGALKDYKRAVIVGSDHTFGKGSVQAVLRLRENMGAIKVTTGMFFTPSGTSTQEQGVLSDIKIPSPYVSKEFSEMSLDYALPHRSIPAFLSQEANEETGENRYTPLSDSILQELAKQSAQRTKKDAEFAKIEKEAKEAEEKKGIVKIAEIMKKTEETNKKEKAKKKSKTDKEAEYLNQPAIQEAVAITVDLMKKIKTDVTIANEPSGKHSKGAPN